MLRGGRSGGCGAVYFRPITIPARQAGSSPRSRTSSDAGLPFSACENPLTASHRVTDVPVNPDP